MDVNVSIALIYDTLGVINEKNQLLSDSNSELKRILAEIGDAWKSNGTDREEYYNQLNKQIQRIEYLCSSIASLKRIINNHVDELKATSSNSLQ